MFDPASIRRQQAMTALGQVGSGLLGFAAGDPRALQSGMAAAAQATDPAVIEQARMRQEMLRLAQQKQQQEVQARQQEMQRQQALQAAIPTLAEESGLPAEMLSIDPGAAMKAVMKARLDRTKMTPFDAFMSGDPAARAAAEQWRQMGRPAGASVEVNLPQFGPVDKGYQMFQDPETGAWRQEMVQGSPAWREAQEQARKQERMDVSTAVEGDLVNMAIGDIRREQQEATLPVTGLAGDVLSNISGTGAANVRSDIDFLKDRTSKRSIQNMRNNSPNGSALGQVSDKDMDLVASEYGRLSQSVGTDKFNRNLDRFEDAYNKVVHNRNPDGSQYRAIPESAPAAPAGAPKVGVTEDGYRFKGGDPSNPDNWELVR